MQIDLEHLHYWMQAIRQSSDPIRTMDAFWSGQLRSKEWLIDNLRPFVAEPVSIEIHGGWVGVLASMLFQSSIECKNIVSIDVDPSCEPIATMMNKSEEMSGKFQAYTSDMCNFDSSSDVVINTSCEHITQEQYDIWLDKLSNGQLIVLQSNNFVELDEHINCSESLEDFIQKSKINVLYSGQIELPLYTRYLIIGRKY